MFKSTNYYIYIISSIWNSQIYVHSRLKPTTSNLIIIERQLAKNLDYGADFELWKPNMHSLKKTIRRLISFIFDIFFIFQKIWMLFYQDFILIFFSSVSFVLENFWFVFMLCKNVWKFVYFWILKLFFGWLSIEDQKLKVIK